MTGAVAAVPRKVTSSRPKRILRVFPSSGWLTILLLDGAPTAERTWLATIPIFTPLNDF
ncbi:unannotated protein [freshwater metagenome]|uniref:Unannotated protein n=1 Tax=freshwater metagenome TaxID=449393 RepID=A0A6J5ZZ22_9ZZZZ